MDAPKLAQAYAKLHPKGLEIIGINGEDTAEVLQQFMGEKKMTWTQTVQEKWEGPIHKLYRFDSWPTYYLVGIDGTIIAKRNDDEVTLADLEKLSGVDGEVSTHVDREMTMTNKLKNAALTLLLSLTFFSLQALAQVAKIEPEQPKWGATLTIIYNPKAEGAKLTMGDEIYLSASPLFRRPLRAPDREDEPRRRYF